jgi:uncharacterized protein (DUF849 family)
MQKKIIMKRGNEAMGELIINLCPTGMVPRKIDTPNVPIAPREIANDVHRCWNAGASIVHIHARNDDEDPTWRRERFSETISEIRAVAPSIVICVTTSGRDWSDFERRSEALGISGDCKPEMASLTLGSMNFPKSASVNAPGMIRDLAGEMLAQGIVPELEVFDVGMANFSARLAAEGVLQAPFYFNILLGSMGTADLSPINLGAILATLPKGATWALAGIGRFQLPANTMAIALGGHVRVGLEDNPHYDWRDRSEATNPRLVERIVRIAREMGREPAAPSEARSIIGLKEPQVLELA